MSFIRSVLRYHCKGRRRADAHHGPGSRWRNQRCRSRYAPPVRYLPLRLIAVLAEYFVVDQSQLVRMPAHMSYEEGSTLTIAAATAWSSLYGHHPTLKAGNTVLCLGTGGVSLFAAQVGFRVDVMESITNVCRRLH